MNQFRINPDEVNRVKRANKIRGFADLVDKTGVSRSTWYRALSTGKPTTDVLDALASLGAKPNKVLILAEEFAEMAA